MILVIFVTFLLTTALYGTLAWLACRRVVGHLQGNPEAVKAVTDHVLLPMLGREAEQKPAGPKTKGTLV